MSRKIHSGMTLIELMIVVAIIGILAAIAYPSYQAQMRKSNRTEAKVALEQRALAYEKCYTRFMAYNNADLTCVNAGVAAPTPDGHYNVAVVAGPTPTTFTLQATPQGMQTADADCMNFSITESGQRTVSGNLSATPERCW